MRAAAILALAATVVAAGADDRAVRAASREPETLVRVSVPGGSDFSPISGFSQDGDVLAWAAGAVRMRNLSTGRTFVIGRAESAGQSYEYGFWIAAAGTRALWGGFTPANFPFGEITLGSPGRRPRRVDGVSNQSMEAGDRIVDIVGDGPTLVYATLVVAEKGDCYPEDSARPKTCRFRVASGAVKRIAGSRAIAVRGVPPAAAIAVAAGRVAVAPADLRWSGPAPEYYTPHARAGGPVDVREVATGRLVRRVRPSGEVEALALSEAVLAVVARDRGTRALSIYDVQTGRRLSRVGVVLRRYVDPELAVSGTTVVYATGGAIRVLHAGRGTTSLVARPSTADWGELSIEGRRVAWAETARDGSEGRILAIDLP